MSKRTQSSSFLHEAVRRRSADFRRRNGEASAPTLRRSAPKPGKIQNEPNSMFVCSQDQRPRRGKMQNKPNSMFGCSQGRRPGRGKMQNEPNLQSGCGGFHSIDDCDVWGDLAVGSGFVVGRGRPRSDSRAPRCDPASARSARRRSGCRRLPGAVRWDSLGGFRPRADLPGSCDGAGRGNPARGRRGGTRQGESRRGEAVTRSVAKP